MRAAATLRAQDPRAREAIGLDVHQALAAYRRGEHYELPMSAVIAAGIKPR